MHIYFVLKSINCKINMKSFIYNVRIIKFVNMKIIKEIERNINKIIVNLYYNSNNLLWLYAIFLFRYKIITIIVW